MVEYAGDNFRSRDLLLAQHDPGVVQILVDWCSRERKLNLVKLFAVLDVVSNGWNFSAGNAFLDVSNLDICLRVLAIRLDVDYGFRWIILTIQSDVTARCSFGVLEIVDYLAAGLILIDLDVDVFQSCCGHRSLGSGGSSDQGSALSKC